MKFRNMLPIIVLCLLCLWGCANTPEPQTEEPAAEAIALYETALVPIRSANNLILNIAYDLQRQVGEETFADSMTAAITYSGIGSADMEAFAEQKYRFGSHDVTYTEFYTGGSAYCQSSGCIFSCPMTAKEFTDRQLPAILLTPSLYNSVTTQKTENRILIRFSEAAAPESWWKNSDIELLSATGTATLDLDGNLLQSAYRAMYRIGQTEYTLQVTNKVATPATLVLSEKFPAGIKDYPTVSDPDAVKVLLRTTGYIRSAQAITCSYKEHLDFSAASILREQQITVNTYGSGDTYMARTDYTGSITDNTGKPTVTNQTELFLDGVKTVSINGSAAITQPGATAEAMESYCQNSILSALFPVSFLQSSRWEEGDSTRTLHFTGTQALADTLYASIYEDLQTGNLDSFCESYATNDISGYLTLDRSTGLPVKAGLSISRTHVIGGISYDLTYQLSSDMLLASPTAYDAITG